MSEPSSSHLGLCLAGGGNRAFWQLGFLSVLGDRIFPHTKAMSGCSAGAAASILLATERTEQAREAFARRRVGVRSNLDARRVLRGESLMPHEGIFRGLLHDILDEEALENLRRRPYPIEILCAQPVAALAGFAGVALGLAVYQAEKLLRPRNLHPTIAPKLGYKARLWDARACPDVDTLVDLVLASSSTPPVMRLGSYEGLSLLDGSLIDNAPAFALDGRVDKTVVLLTRPYPKGALGVHGRRLYLAPTERVPVERWDYREVAPIDETFALGVRDAERHADELERFLAS